MSRSIHNMWTRNRLRLCSRADALLLACLVAGVLSVSEALAGQGITGIKATYETNARTNDDYAATGATGSGGAFDPATTYNIKFNITTQNNLRCDGFEVGTNEFSYILLADRINLARIDNPTPCTGALHIILYEDNGYAAGTNIDFKSSYTPTMESSLLSVFVNRGSDNTFCNTGNGNGNNNNIERIDYIFADGYPLHDNSSLRGFVIMDRGGNDQFKIAAITNLDAGGRASGFAPPVTALTTDWGWSGISINTLVMRGYTDGGDRQRPSANVSLQDLDGIYFTWQELGLVTGQVCYGYALVANDVTNGANWLNPTNFPLDTTEGGANAGLDLISGGSMFFDKRLNGTVGDFVWDDYNGNGIQDDGEPGISNVLVRVYDTNGVFSGVTRTFSNGYYQVRGLATDYYYVKFYLPTNYYFSPANQGSDTNINSKADTNTGTTASFYLLVGTTNNIQDAGMHRAPTDLAVAKTVSTNRPNELDVIAYTIVVTNKGPQTANRVQLTDLLPTGVSYVSAGASQGAYTSGTGLWDVGTITNGFSAKLTITASVDTLTAAWTITNTACVSRMDRPDINPLDNTSSVPLTVKSIDLGVTKTVDNAAPATNDLIGYRIVLTNYGPDMATGVTVTDSLPSGVTYVSYGASSGTYSQVSGIWTVGTVAVNGFATLTITGRVNAGTGGQTITNTVSTRSANQRDTNSLNNTSSCTIRVVGADLAVSKTVDNAAPNEGNSIAYTIVVTNLGPSTATGVAVTDSVPAGVTYSSYGASSGTYSQASGIWTVGTIAVSGSATLTITGSVNAGTAGSAITNRAVAYRSNQPDPDLSNNTGTVTIVVSGLRVTKTSDVATYAYPGSNITYTIIVTNIGASTHTNIVVSDSVPDGTTYVTNTVTISQIPPVLTSVVYAASSTFAVPTGVTNATVEAWGGGGGGATRTSNGGGGGGGGGAYSRSTVTVLPGSNYTVNVGAGGAANTTGGDSWFSLGSVTSVLAKGGTGGTLNSANGAAGGASASGIGDTRYSGGTGANGVTGSYGGGGGSSAGTNATGNSAANATGATAPAGGGDGGNGKSTPQGNGSNGSAPGGGGGGGLRTFNGTRTGGTGGVGRVTITYAVPNVPGTPPTLASNCTLVAGQALRITFQCLVTNPISLTAITNIVSVTSAQQPVPVVASVTNPVISTDVGVYKTVNNSNPWAGSNIVYTIVATNNGPGGVTGLQITDRITNGITYVGHGLSQGSYTAASGLWSVGSVAVGASATLTITAGVNSGTAGTSITNTAQITAMDQADTNPSNNISSVVINVVGADLGVSKAVNEPLPYVGNQVMYTMVVSNNGPSAATGVSLTDQLPGGISYVSNWVSAGSYNSGSGVWTVGGLAVGADETLILYGLVATNTVGWSITNRVSITARDQPDPVSANDSNSVVVVPQPLPLRISKSSSAAGGLVDMGDTITYTMIVTNIGSTTQTTVSVTDPLPSGVVYAAGTASVTAPQNVNADVLDQFNNRSYGNNDGSESWSGSWVESEGDGPLVGNLLVEFDNVRGGTYTFHFAGATNSMTRSANLSGSTNATLSFIYRREALDAGDYVAIQVSTNGAGNWVELARFSGPAADTAYLSTNFDIIGYAGTNTTIRFATTNTAMTAADIVWIDDVQISFGRREMVTAAGGSPPSLATGYELRGGEYMAVTYQVVVSTPPTVYDVTNLASVTSAQMPVPRYGGVTDSVARADLAVAKSVNNSTPTVGATIDYTIILTNNGPHRSLGVALQDVLPNGLTYSNATASSGSYNAVSGVWTVGTVAAYGSASLVIRAKLTNSDAFANTWITNWAALQTSRTYDTVLTNNSSHADIRPKPTVVVISGFWGAGGGVEWETASEAGTVGFYVYRQNEAGGWDAVNRALLPGLLVSPQGGRYWLADAGARPGKKARYKVVEVEVSGERNEYGPYEVTVLPKTAGMKQGRGVEYERRAKEVTSEKAMRIAGRKAETRRDTESGSRAKVVVKETGLYYVSAKELGDALALPEWYVEKLISKYRLEMESGGDRVRYAAAGVGEGMYFYGEALERNNLSPENVYWVGLGKGQSPGVVYGWNAKATEKDRECREQEKEEEERYAVPALVRDPAQDYWMWDYLIAGDGTLGTKTYTVNADRVGTGGVVRVMVKMLGGSRSGVSREHHVMVSVNGVEVGEGWWTGTEEEEIEGSVAARVLREGTNGVEVRAELEEGVPYSVVYVNSVELEYNRKLTARSNVLEFSTTTGAIYTVAGFTNSGISVVEVTDAKTTVPMSRMTVDQGTGGDWRVSFYDPKGGKRFVAFTGGGVKRAERVEGVEATTLAQTTNRGNYVVITVPELEEGAEVLAAYRQGQGYETKVVTLEAIYDAFNEGVADPEAIKRFLRYAYHYWDVSPEYVVLVGEGTFDYRNNLGYGDNLVPPKMVSTPDGLYESDGWYGDVVGEDGIPEMAVGRLPVMTQGELTNWVAKVEGYEEEGAGSWTSLVVLAADNGDEGGDFAAGSDAVGRVIPAAFTKQKIYLSEKTIGEARTELLNAWNAGTVLVNYVGHGGLDRLSQEGLLVSGDVGGMANGAKEPVVLMMTCMAARYGVPGYDCLGELLVMKNGGGAAGVWGPTGLSQNEQALVLDEGFLRSRYDDQETILGDAVRSALEDYGWAGRPLYMMQIYNLLGDPATRIK